MSEEENSLFAEAMQDVKPLKATTKKRVSAKPPGETQQREIFRAVRKKQHQQKQEKTETMSSGLNHSFEIHDVGAFESMSFQQPGLRKKDFVTLQKGNFKVEAVLDLHGFTAAEAEQKIDAFVALCYSRQQRFVRIIHGKGYNSDYDKPILKNLTNQALRSFNEVVAFCSAAEKDGGVGAVNVLLKAH